MDATRVELEDAPTGDSLIDRARTDTDTDTDTVVDIDDDLLLVVARRLWAAADRIEALHASRLEQLQRFTEGSSGPLVAAVASRIETEGLSTRSVADGLRLEARFQARLWVERTAGPTGPAAPTPMPPVFEPHCDGT